MIGKVSANWGSAFPEGILTKENKILDNGTNSNIYDYLCRQTTLGKSLIWSVYNVLGRSFANLMVCVLFAAALIRQDA